MSNTRSESPSPSTEKSDEGNEQKRESPETASDTSRSPTPEQGLPNDPPEASSSKHVDEKREGTGTSVENSDPDEGAGSKPPTDTQQTDTTTQPFALTNAHVQGDWQAIWSPQHGMYYFYNIRTQETTWTNPLVPDSSSSNSGPGPSSSSRMSVEAAAAAAGIDPELAYLDPTLLAGPSQQQSSAFAYTAKFNARTGAFAKPDALNPEHVSEYERMKRMNSFYFDMDSWQSEVEQRQAEEQEAGKKRKKPTKKDLELFKERKKQKKLAKTAWLRT